MRCLDIAFLPDIAAPKHHAFTERLRQGASQIVGHVGDDDARPFLVEEPNGGLAETARSTGHDGDSILQPLHHVTSLSVAHRAPSHIAMVLQSAQGGWVITRSRIYWGRMV
jgi:hypothetical protein